MDIRARVWKVLDEHPEWSPRSISLAAGLSDSALTKFLNPNKPGGIKSMTLENMEKIAAALGVSTRWLIFGEDYPREINPKIVYIWDHIPERRREQALQILETFTEDEEGAARA